MKISVCLQRIVVGMALKLMLFMSATHAEMASVYGGRTVIAEVAPPMESE